MQIEINSPEEAELVEQLKKRTDPEAKRMLRFLNMPDLSRQAGSPIAEIVNLILKTKLFSKFDTIKVPEIVPYDISFDVFNFSADHPARNRSDTYFIDQSHVLRTHTTVMWYYHVNYPVVKEKIKNKEAVGAVCYGKVFRKDEIDRSHMNVFHQIDAWYIAPKNQKIIGVEDLKEVLIESAKAVYGPDIQYRFNKDEFPYTDPSLEMEINLGNRWIEVLGSGVVHTKVLENLDIDPDQYNGWAFGSGLERLAILSMDLPDIRLLWSEDPRVKKQLKLGNKFKEVSKYPAITRDISFVVTKDFIPNNYFDLIRDLGGILVEEVQLIDKYEDTAKFGPDRVSYTYRIIYRSNERTLVSSEVDATQNEIYNQTAKQFKAELR